MEFKLFSKLASLEGTELLLLILFSLLFAALLAAVIRYKKKARATAAASPVKNRTRAYVYGALCLSLSFVLSYFKLFSLLFGGSITLCSMLPLMLYAHCFGPKYGFGAAFAYALLQIVQGAYIVHPVQFILDYFVAFVCLGIPALFPENLFVGCAAGGFSRMLVSTVSGAVFFASAGLDYGYANPWTYSFLYNLITIGADTVLVLLAVALLPIRRFKAIMK